MQRLKTTHEIQKPQSLQPDPYMQFMYVHLQLDSASNSNCYSFGRKRETHKRSHFYTKLTDKKHRISFTYHNVKQQKQVDPNIRHTKHAMKWKLVTYQHILPQHIQTTDIERSKRGDSDTGATRRRRIFLEILQLFQDSF